MIPIRNKKKELKVTVEEMRNFAFAYVEKYALSKQQLKTYFLNYQCKTDNAYIIDERKLKILHKGMGLGMGLTKYTNVYCKYRPI